MAVEQIPKLPNEFLSSPDDNRVRPFTVGLKQHDETIASIVLYTAGDSSGEKQEIEHNYLADLSTNVNDLIAGATSSSVQPVSDIPGGKVAMITLDERNKNEFYGVFNNFSLTSVNEAHGEIVKIHQNFTDGWNAFFFGEKPVVYQYSGMFIDSKEYPYYQEFMVAYEKYLAGRRCVENGMNMKMLYDGRIIDGYMLSINVGRAADTPLTKTFTFTVLVRSAGWVRVNLVPIYSPEIRQYSLEEQFNGLSNKYRLNRLTDGLIDADATSDTDGKTSPTEPNIRSGGGNANRQN